MPSVFGTATVVVVVVVVFTLNRSFYPTSAVPHPQCLFGFFILERYHGTNYVVRQLEKN